ncbi:MAG: four helix bundle protein [Candidatus Bipolaricaulota bacterium]|nr:four helix bundle protein [Candidatus Bipolaricaulota bacterium]
MTTDEAAGCREVGMARIERFEDLRIWKLARDVANRLYALSANASFSRDFVLRDQIRRAAVSMPSNIAEGFSRRSNKEFVQFLFVAKGSAAEAQSQLYLARDQGYLPEEEFDRVYREIDLLARQISRFITYLKAAG